MDLVMDMGSIAVGEGAAIKNTNVSADAFRAVMRQLAGSVAVITTEGNGKLHGFTATADCSVCAEPPTILIAVNKSARTHPHIDRKGIYAVNILADDQRHRPALCRQGRGSVQLRRLYLEPERRAVHQWRSGSNGVRDRR